MPKVKEINSVKRMIEKRDIRKAKQIEKVIARVKKDGIRVKGVKMFHNNKGRCNSNWCTTNTSPFYCNNSN